MPLVDAQMLLEPHGLTVLNVLFVLFLSVVDLMLLNDRDCTPASAVPANATACGLLRLTLLEKAMLLVVPVAP